MRYDLTVRMCGTGTWETDSNFEVYLSNTCNQDLSPPFPALLNFRSVHKSIDIKLIPTRLLPGCYIGSSIYCLQQQNARGNTMCPSPTAVYCCNGAKNCDPASSSGSCSSTDSLPFCCAVSGKHKRTDQIDRHGYIVPPAPIVGIIIRYCIYSKGLHYCNA